MIYFTNPLLHFLSLFTDKWPNYTFLSWSHNKISLILQLFGLQIRQSFANDLIPNLIESIKDDFAFTLSVNVYAKITRFQYQLFLIEVGNQCQIPVFNYAHYIIFDKSQQNLYEPSHKPLQLSMIISGHVHCRYGLLRVLPGTVVESEVHWLGKVPVLPLDLMSAQLLLLVKRQGLNHSILT